MVAQDKIAYKNITKKIKTKLIINTIQLENKF